MNHEREIRTDLDTGAVTQVLTSLGLVGEAEWRPGPGPIEVGSGQYYVVCLAGSGSAWCLFIRFAATPAMAERVRGRLAELDRERRLPRT
jgi:hypothetical protein